MFSLLENDTVGDFIGKVFTVMTDFNDDDINFLPIKIVVTETCNLTS